MLIEKAGYPVEIHMATTDDGYILEMHRIPHGKINSSLHSNGPRPVVYLQHCLLCSSAEFVLRDPPTALGIFIKINYLYFFVAISYFECVLDITILNTSILSFRLHVSRPWL